MMNKSEYTNNAINISINRGFNIGFYGKNRNNCILYNYETKLIYVISFQTYRLQFSINEK